MQVESTNFPSLKPPGYKQNAKGSQSPLYHGYAMIRNVILLRKHYNETSLQAD